MKKKFMTRSKQLLLNIFLLVIFATVLGAMLFGFKIEEAFIVFLIASFSIFFILTC